MRFGISIQPCLLEQFVRLSTAARFSPPAGSCRKRGGHMEQKLPNDSWAADGRICTGLLRSAHRA
jgi:hypothetical protein